jgi:NAD(P)H-dependent FMN reductase
MIKIGVIVGSNRPNRMGRKVADWFMEQVKDTPNVEFQLIDLQEVGLPFLDEPKLPAQGDYVQEHTKRWSKIIAPLDGFVLVASEYNHGYAANLKNALDFLHAEWAKKPVAFVGYGSMGAVASIEQLVNITAQLNMVPSPSTAVKIIDAWSALDEAGNVKPEHVRGKIDGLIDNLTWWAEALKKVRG